MQNKRTNQPGVITEKLQENCLSQAEPLWSPVVKSGTEQKFNVRMSSLIFAAQRHSCPKSTYLDHYPDSIPLQFLNFNDNSIQMI